MKILLGVLLSMACGGAVATPLVDGGGSDAANDSPPTCDQLFQQLTSETTAATSCCPTCKSLQCTAQVDGLCCPLTVSNATSDAVKTYEATLAQIKASHCAVNCPALACSTKPTMTCDAINGGTCRQ
jgi:hypothetical protein